MAVGQHLFPFRTEKLRPLTPKILREILGKIGRRRGFTHNIFTLCHIFSLLTLFIFYKSKSNDFSLEFILLFGYNPFVLQRAERGFLVALEITAQGCLIF